jgi:hypothetical protein
VTDRARINAKSDLFEERNEVQAPAKDGRERERIERYPSFHPHFPEARSVKEFLPLFIGKIVIRQFNAMGSIAYPVHEAKSRMIEAAFREMVFD